MAKKLTDLQVAVLRDAQAGKLWRSDSVHDLYDSYSDNRRGKVNRQVDVLSDRDLICIGDRQPFRRPWHITEAGVKVLADLDATAATD